MPQWDRWWPLGIAAGGALLVTGGSLGLWYLASLFALPALVGLPLIHTLSGLGSATIIDGTLGGLAALHTSRQARRRAQARRLALRGNLSAMALADISADASKAPSVDDLPLTLIWRRRPKGREWGQALFLALLLLPGPVALLIVAPMLLSDSRSALLLANTSNLVDAFGAMLLMGVVACLDVIAWVALIQALFARLGPEYAVDADVNGIRSLHLQGEGPLVPWAAVRLFEVLRYLARDGGHVFSVYAANTTIWWLDAQKPHGESPAVEEDRWDRQQQMVALVVARTGMQPRTCAPAQMRDAPMRQMPRGYRILKYGFLYGVIGALFLQSLAALALPLTPFVVLNAYAAATTAVLGAAAVSTMRQARESPHAASYTLPAVPKLPDEALQITYRRRRAGQLPDVLIGVLLLLDVVPAFVAAIYPPASPLRAFAAKVDFTLLLVLALLGAMMIIDGLSRKHTRLNASGKGLTRTHGRKASRLAWGDIVKLSVTMGGSGPTYFAALRRDGESIDWPAQNVIWRGSVRAPAPVSPEELAAIVAERSGARLAIE